MAEAARMNTEQVIDRLGAELTPVRRLAAPIWRALAWVALVCLVALVLASRADLPAIGRRLADEPDMWLAALGSALTATLAAIATFQLSLPDRSRRWALLPLPAAALWVGASGAGCLRTDLIAGVGLMPMAGAASDCLPFILEVSVPLALVMILMLRRARPLQPGLTATMGGLASAAAAASLLCFVHSFDASAADLLVHAAAVLITVAVTRWGGRRVL